MGRVLGAGLLVLGIALSGGCATVRTLDAAKPGAPLVYAGTRLDWYSLNGGCCPVERFGAEAPRMPRWICRPAHCSIPCCCHFVGRRAGLQLGVTGGL